MAIKRKWSLLLFIALCVLSVGLRLVYIKHSDGTGWTEMERAANTLAQHGFIGNVFSSYSGKSAHVAPLYPIFLACIYTVFGVGSSWSILAQKLCAIAATTIGLCMLPFVSRRLGFGSLPGWAAGFALSVLPVNLWIETSGCWEQPFAALATIMLFLILSNMHEQEWCSKRIIMASGVLFGATALLAPQLLTIPMAAMTLEFFYQRHQRKDIVIAGAISFMIIAFIISPWAFRNYRALGSFIPLRSNLGLELAIGNNPQANGKTYTTAWDTMGTTFKHPFSHEEERNRLLQLGEAAYMKQKLNEALLWMKDNPKRAIALVLQRFSLFWFPPVDMWAPSSTARLMKSIVFSIIGAGALCGLFLLLFTKHWAFGILLAVIVGPSLPYMITHVDPRYRYPVFGISTVLAFHFALEVLRFIKCVLLRPKQVCRRGGSQLG